MREERGQLDLFRRAETAPSVEPRAGVFAQRLAREHAETAAIAARLPEGVFFGTSSWSFPDWAGIVYSRRSSAAVLAREGLAEYARHPLLKTVGIDRSFYAPIPERDLARYAEQLPAGFRCLAKAPEAVTSVLRTAGAGRGETNSDFLDPELFRRESIEPFRAAFRDHTGPFLLQFPPAQAGARLPPGEFAERLDRFLAALPLDFRYAVELRQAELLTPEYRRVLEARGAAHVYNYAATMPMPEEQEQIVPLTAASFAVVRLLLPPGTRYEERRVALAPFDRASDPDGEMRRQVVSLARRAGELGRPVSILVNNKAEGCAPLTIRALAQLLAEEGASPA